jgi:UDP-N-acetylglucosamine diphosphorylase/glucosamine-1-phosphate N-acetyltransferase
MNSQKKLALIIMAAGKGTRMKSDLAKVLHPLGARAMIHYVIDTAKKLKASPIVVVVGHQKEQVKCELSQSGVRFTIQEPQLGTGHAVMCAISEIEDTDGSVLVLSGDVPLIRSTTLNHLIDHHFASTAAATVMTAIAANPSGYGRIVRRPQDTLAAIIEERDADAETRRITEINSGIYVFNMSALQEALPKLNTDNDQKEYYLTDVVRLLVASGCKVGAFQGDFTEVMGINTVAELESAHEMLLNRELHPEGEV